MLITGLAQLRFAASLVLGRPFALWSKANPVNQLPRTGENIMVKVYFRYIRYTLSMLATVGFGLRLPN
jgi:hypothetical protein